MICTFLDQFWSIFDQFWLIFDTIRQKVFKNWLGLPESHELFPGLPWIGKKKSVVTKIGLMPTPPDSSFLIYTF